MISWVSATNHSIGTQQKVSTTKNPQIYSGRKKLLLIKIHRSSHYSTLNPNVSKMPTTRDWDIRFKKTGHSPRTWQQSSPTAVTHLCERFTQSQGGSDGFFPSPTVSGADAGGRFQYVTRSKIWLRVYTCVHKILVHTSSRVWVTSGVFGG